MRVLSAHFNTGTVNSNTTIGTIDNEHLTFLSYQASVSGSLSGTLQLWVSNDNKNFVQISNADQLITGPQNAVIEVVDVCCPYVQFRMAVSSGSGVIDMVAYAKGNS
jgi:hypothetical protein